MQPILILVVLNIKMNKKVVILGLGWLGLPLANQLLREGYSVIGTKRNLPNQLPKNGLLISTWQLGEPLPIELRKADYYVFTLPPSADEAFVVKTKFLFEGIPSNATLLFCSSTSVYGNQTGVLYESSSLEGGRRSGALLVELEHYLQTDRAFNRIVLRFAGLIGPRRHPIFSLSGRTIDSNENQTVNLIHQEDVIGIIYKILSRLNTAPLIESYQVYNLSSGEQISKRLYYGALAKRFGILPPTYADGNKTIQQRIISNEKIKDEFAHNFRSILDYKL